MSHPFNLTDADLAGMSRERLARTLDALRALRMIPPQNPSRVEWLTDEMDRVLAQINKLDELAAPVEAAMAGCAEGNHDLDIMTATCRACGATRSDIEDQRMSAAWKARPSYGSSLSARGGKLQADLNEVMTIADLNEVMTINEVRASQGLPPLDGGDVTLNEWNGSPNEV